MTRITLVLTADLPLRFGAWSNLCFITKPKTRMEGQDRVKLPATLLTQNTK